MTEAIFDSWTDQYDAWFDNSIGRFIKEVESELLLKMLSAKSGERILDVGCGTGIFTQDVLQKGCRIIGVDLSSKMLLNASRRLNRKSFNAACADMIFLPFCDGSFDRVFSMTAVEFVVDLKKAVEELNRVTRNGGTIVLTTLNRLSPWADRRIKKAKKGHALFESILFRSPDEIRNVVPEGAVIKTAIHFQKKDPVDLARTIENQHKDKNLDTGAFLVAQWIKE